ncbi:MULTISPECIES: molecular chaperone [unclassified Serratia (in: enterobacteria)]|uniref:fimbrial biogenesis chaperone n=1 Tax=unclassified Serratia (in: enterobacteria) TaxID=2647522 RepID=UPI000506A33E|nr:MULTISPECIES: molecular chaperone [unclassified Serratia (in: enterobacteria)]KFK96916.1 pilus assembly protein PapD [Serratia sp. Ag2]KFK97459.1 pilus assembly protein PapD [Serratia sp. Ag1]
MSRIFPLRSVLFSLLMLPALSQADGFGINATRLIYPQGTDSISVTVRNTMTTQPYLVQAKVSGSQDGSQPAPFIARPSLFRLEPSSINQIRIVGQSAALPTDRESIFYFHASAIPASTTPSSNGQNNRVSGTAQFGVGNIIKLFYRPTNLPSSSIDAQKNLQFSRVKEGLHARNNSPYFVSFSSLRLGSQTLKLDTPATLMLAPFSSHIYPTTATQNTVHWETINDEGGINAFNYKLP